MPSARRTLHAARNLADVVHIVNGHNAFDEERTKYILPKFILHTAYCMLHTAYFYYIRTYYIRTYYILHTAYCILHTACYILHTSTTYYILHTAYCILHTEYCILHATYCILLLHTYILHTAYCILHTTFCILHTTYYMLHLASIRQGEGFAGSTVCAADAVHAARSLRPTLRSGRRRYLINTRYLITP